MPKSVEETHDLPLAGVRSSSFQVGDRVLSYVVRGNPKGTPVVYIHGSPGSWKDAKRIMADEALSDYCFVAVNRPGWGKSDGPVVPSPPESARLLIPSLDVCGSGKKAILAGHSLGGPIAAQMAADYPDRLAGLVLLAASMDPDLRPVRWYNELADFKVIKFMLPDELVKSNDEIIGLDAELRKLASLLKHITTPAIVVQGDKDKLVEPANADYAERMLVNAPVKIRWIKDYGHFIPFTRPEEVVAAILELASGG